MAIQSISEQFSRVLDENIKSIITFLAFDIQRELIDQGHILTGKLRDSIQGLISLSDENTTEAIVLIEEYYSFLERTLPGSRVPYRRGSGAGESKLITALRAYWEKRGLSEKEAKGAAFATAEKWKQEGRPTNKSYEFSSNQRRLEFLNYTVANARYIDSFPRTLQAELEQIFERTFDLIKLKIA